MYRFSLHWLVLSLFGSFCAKPWLHNYGGKNISLTGYRTRINNDKRWLIVEGKSEDKLYSVTITLKPDVMTKTELKAHAWHSVTLTISKEDYGVRRTIASRRAELYK